MTVDNCGNIWYCPKYDGKEYPIDLDAIEKSASIHDVATITTFGGSTSLVGIRRHIFDAFERSDGVNIERYGITRANGIRGLKHVYNKYGNPYHINEKHSNDDWVYFQASNDIKRLRRDIEKMRVRYYQKMCTSFPCSSPIPKTSGTIYVK